MSRAVRAMRRGDTHDIEDFHFTHRLQAAWALLRSFGVIPINQPHANECERHPDRLARVLVNWRDRVVCTCGAATADVALPEWLSDDLLTQTYALASALQTARGEHHRAQASREKTERESARLRLATGGSPAGE